MAIEIKIRYSEDSLFGPDGPDGYDVRGSYEKFEKKVREEIAKINTSWAVEFDRGINDDVRVGCDTMDEYDLADGIKTDVFSAIGVAWEAWDWAIAE